MVEREISELKRTKKNNESLQKLFEPLDFRIFARYLLHRF